jgi:hypothetical protein
MEAVAAAAATLPVHALITVSRLRRHVDAAALPRTNISESLQSAEISGASNGK